MNGNILTNGEDGVTIADNVIVSQLTVTDSAGRQGGEYVCTANNIVGSSNVTIDIQCKDFLNKIMKMLLRIMFFMLL